MTSSASSSICDAGSPLSSSIDAQSSARHAAARASKPSVCSSMNAWSSTVPGAASSRSSSALFTPANSARSPLTRTGRNRSASSVPWPAGRAAFCGFLNRISPASGSGLTATIVAPRCLASSSADEHPRVVGARVLPDDHDQVGVVEMSSRVTVPLPIPIVSVSAAPLDSWHMFEQSGRLLVPSRGRAAGRRTRPRCRPGRWCRRRARFGSGERAEPGRRSAGTRRPRRSACSGWRPAARYIGSVSRPLASSQWSVCSRRSATGCAAKNAASDPLARRLPGHRLRAVLAELRVACGPRRPGRARRSSGSRNRRPGSSAAASARDRAGPISASAYRIETATPGTPTADVSGSPTRKFPRPRLRLAHTVFNN